MPALAAIVTGGSIFMLLAYVIRSRALRPSEGRLEALGRDRQVSLTTGPTGEAVLKRGHSSIPALTDFLTTRGYGERWTLELERADVKLRAGEYFLMRSGLALLAFAFIAMAGKSPVAVFAALIVGVIAFLLPAYYLRFRTQRRIKKINGQLVETITQLSNGLSAGFAFAQSLAVAAQRMGPPISTELNRMLLDVNLGASTEDALVAMNERIQSDDVDMVVTAILIQRTTGGNLGEVLNSVTETMRDRERIEGEIKTLTSSQKLTGWVLSLWPAALAGIFFLVNRDMMSLMWTTSVGVVLLVIWIILNLLGIITIRKILDIDI
jgi:tight adherence protein B